ncbi:MAG: hypothetical protein J0H55_08520 [Chitinophagaceae bacterium]|nr:hypothetical protein [Chitinophagaceae bacterium]
MSDIIKSFFTVFVLALLSLSIASCKKQKVAENNGIVGKWLFTELFDGYANGGSFKWNDISFENSHTISFDSAGHFYKHDNSNANPDCSGSYRWDLPGILIINSSCSTVEERWTVSEMTSQMLIIDIQGIEGISRYKYMARK